MRFIQGNILLAILITFLFACDNPGIDFEKELMKPVMDLFAIKEAMHFLQENFIMQYVKSAQSHS